MSLQVTAAAPRPLVNAVSAVQPRPEQQPAQKSERPAAPQEPQKPPVTASHLAKQQAGLYIKYSGSGPARTKDGEEGRVDAARRNAKTAGFSDKGERQ